MTERERKSKGKKKGDSNACFIKILMWRLIQGNVLGFLGMFKVSHIWLQITLGDQMPGEFGYPL